MPPPSAASSRPYHAPQLGVERLVGPPAERHRHPDPPAVGLALVQQGDAGQRQGDGGRGAVAGGASTAASRGSSWFSTKRTVWAWYAGSAREVGADRRRRLAVDEPVVEALVVAGVEALLDEHRLEVPVRLGPEREVGVGRAGTAPITVGQ